MSSIHPAHPAHPAHPVTQSAKKQKDFFEWSFSPETFDLLRSQEKSDREKRKQKKSFYFFTGKVKKKGAGENDQINILIRGSTYLKEYRPCFFFCFSISLFLSPVYKVCTGYKLG